MNRKSLQLCLPVELKRWIAAQAVLNGSSQNSEIVRSIRERMETSPSHNGPTPHGKAD
jgi:hypothetical protein